MRTGCSSAPAFVVVHVPVAAAGAFHLFDDPVEALGAGVGDAVLQGDGDVRPPGLDGVGEPGGLGHAAGGAVPVERPEPFPQHPRVRGDASSIRSRSMQPHAAPISFVGSSAASIAWSRSSCLRESRSPAVSSSRRCAHAASVLRPRRPCRSRDTRCRTCVTMSPPQAGDPQPSFTRCQWSTAICTPGRAARMPEAYGAWACPRRPRREGEGR
jgi:hypothetical protein